nr:hypothetical protein [Alteromonas macleodii]
MNAAQANEVRNLIEEYYSIDVAGLISQTYMDSPTLNEVKIGEYSVKEYSSYLNKIFGQFREELNGPYFKALPYTYNFHNEFGSSNLRNDLSAILVNIKNKTFASTVGHLNRLIHYQAVNGFWEKSKRKYFRASEASVKEEENRIALVARHLEDASNTLEKLFDSVDREKEDLSNFVNSKTKELNEIEALLESVRKHAKETNDLRTEATGDGERVSSILQQAEEKRTNIVSIEQKMDSLFEELRSHLKDAGRLSADIDQESKDLYKQFETLLAKVESKTDYFDERNKYLNDLIGKEVGVSLFATFKQRKEEFKAPLNLWRWAVPISAIATVIWIYILFGSGDLSQLSWQVFLANTFKALPAAGLLFFAISQYVKERNFQEEYAFKSAVALTIEAYAETLHDPKSKDQMILDSVSKVYQSPINHRKVDLGQTNEQNIKFDEFKSLITDIFKSKG